MHTSKLSQSTLVLQNTRHWSIRSVSTSATSSAGFNSLVPCEISTSVHAAGVRVERIRSLACTPSVGTCNSSAESANTQRASYVSGKGSHLRQHILKRRSSQKHKAKEYRRTGNKNAATLLQRGDRVMRTEVLRLAHVRSTAASTGMTK
jgi:hypothetical protein